MFREQDITSTRSFRLLGRNILSATPIFDLVEPLPAPSKSSRVTYLISVLVGVLLGVAMVRLSVFHKFDLLLFLPALYVAVAIHEAGHLIAGAIVRMPPGAVVVGGLVIFKSGSNWCVRFDYRRILGGGRAMVLPEKGEFRRVPYAWMVAGGPIASIVFTLVMVVITSRWGAGRGGWADTLLSVAGLTTIAPLIPISSGMTKSDVARLWLLARHPEQCRPWMALYALQTEVTHGVLPRNWDDELVDQILMFDRRAREYSYVHLLAFYRCLDQDYDELALGHLENALLGSARASKVLRQCIFLEAAFRSAWYRQNVAQARTWLERVGEVREPLSTDGVEAVIAMRENRYDDASRLWASVRTRMTRRKLGSGLARFAVERLERYERLCQEATSNLGVANVTSEKAV